MKTSSLCKAVRVRLRCNNVRVYGFTFKKVYYCEVLKVVILEGLKVVNL